MFYKIPLHWLIFLNILILLVLPQLNTNHYDPLPEYWAEITFAFAGICLFLIVAFAFNEINIPRIVIPLSLFGIFLAVQQYFVKIDYVGLSYVASFEMLLCILLVISISTLIVQLGIETTISMICLSLIVGAILQSAIGLLQYTGLYKIFGNLIFYDSLHPTTNIFGHFGQRNHYCHYLSWAVFGLIYLYSKNKIKLPIFIVITAWLIFSMTIASSRSVFMYFALATFISLVNFLFKRTNETKKLFLIIIITSTVLIGVEYIYPILSKLFVMHNQISSGLQRIAADSGDGGLAGRRIVEWEKAWIVFKENPIFGFGWNEYAKQSVFLQPLSPNAPLNSGLFTNCHNIILQLLAETGIIGTVIAVIGILYSLYAILKRNNTESIIILCMIFTTIAHSMVEYPLWYIYFFGPLIIFLSVDKPIATINSNIMAGVSVIPVSAMVYLMFKGSFLFDVLVNYIDTPTDKKSFTAQANFLKNIVNNNVLWSYPAMYTLDNYINVNDPNTNSVFSTKVQLDYENQFTFFHPYPDNMIKLAMLNWNLGNESEARKFVNLALVSFPVYKSSYLTSLKDKKYITLYNIAKEYKYK